MDPNAFNSVSSYEGPCNDELLPPIEQIPPICVFITTVRNLAMVKKISQKRLRRSPPLPELSIQEMIDTCPRSFVNLRGVNDIHGYADFFLSQGTISALHCPFTQAFDVQHAAREETPVVERYKPNVCEVITLGEDGVGPVKFFKMLKACLDDGQGPICVRVSCNKHYDSETRQGILYNPHIRCGYWHMLLGVSWGNVNGQEVLLCQDSQGIIIRSWQTQLSSSMYCWNINHQGQGRLTYNRSRGFCTRNQYLLGVVCLLSLALPHTISRRGFLEVRRMYKRLLGSQW